MKVKIAQSCLTLFDPMDGIVHGIPQARKAEWVAIPFSRGSSQPRSPTLQADSFYGQKILADYSLWVTSILYIIVCICQLQFIPCPSSIPLW